MPPNFQYISDDMEDSYESEEKSSTTNKPSRSTKEAYKESIHNWADREYKQLQLSEDLDHHDVNVPRNTLLCR